jgi:NADH:ubiquinone oxidoreductase subunit 5 (subunit L)/multisubunit Na+/H+ antiporter MnhA subunit
MLSRPLFPRTMLPYVVDSPFLMTAPLIILSFAAVMLGYFTHELFLSFGSSFYLNSLFTHPNTNIFLFDASLGETGLISLIPVTFLFLIFLIFFIAPFKSLSTPASRADYINNINLTPTLSKFSLTTHFTLLNYFNVFYHWIKYIILSISNYVYRYIDKGFLEVFGPLGCTRLINFWGYLFEKFSTGFLSHYA